MANNEMAPAPAGMFAAFEWMFAWAYLRSRRKERSVSIIAGFSLVGIMLGVMTLIVVMAIMNGFRTELLSKILGVNGHLALQPIESPLNDYDDIVKKLSTVEKVRAVIPFIEGKALVTGNGGETGARVRGIRSEDFQHLLDINNNIIAGELHTLSESKGVALGATIAASLGVSVGDMVQLISHKGDFTPFGQTPRIKSYPVMAVYKTGMFLHDNTVIYIPFKEAQTYFNQENQASHIEIFTHDPDKIDGMINIIEKAADRPVLVSDWRQTYKAYFDALAVERNVMFFVLTLIILVASMNVISSMIILVKDKARDIAILRTMGATRGAIMRIFFIAGSSIGFIGTLLGTALGLLICQYIDEIRLFLSTLLGVKLLAPEIYYLTKLPVDLRTYETITIIVVAIIISFLATIFPALRAASTDPVEAIRYE